MCRFRSLCSLDLAGFSDRLLDTLQGANPFAVAMFAQFVIMLFYFNANNQCLQAGEGFAAFSILLILWLKTRRRLDNGARRRTIWN